MRTARAIPISTSSSPSWCLGSRTRRVRISPRKATFPRQAPPTSTTTPRCRRESLRQRSVDDGTISRFGAIDPTDGGKTSRYSLSLDRHKALENGAVFHMDVYAIKYRLNLFSNFTFFLDNPFPVGDQFEQSDERTIVGLTPSWVFDGKWDERQVTHKFGLDARDRKSTR